MNYFKVFFYVWKRSFSSAEYYKDVVEAPFSFSLKYFIFYSFLLALIAVLFLFFRFYLPLSGFINRFPSVLVKSYPNELEIKIINGEVSTNVQEPYFIPVDQFEKNFEELNKDIKGVSSDQLKNLLVIDTKANVDDIKKYQTAALLTKGYLSYYRDDGRIETYSLKDVKNLTINRAFVQGTLSNLAPVLKTLSLFLIPLVLVGIFFLLLVWQLTYLVITALVLYLIAKLIVFDLTYPKAYQIDLHLTSIITPFFLLLTALGFDIRFPLLRLIVFSLIGWYILKSLKKSTLAD